MSETDSQTGRTQVQVIEPSAERRLLDMILDEVHSISTRPDRPTPIQLKSLDEIERFAVRAAISGMVPPFYNEKPDAIVIAVQMGSELGLQPIQALQNIAVINGRPAVWGDAMPGLCWASGKVEYIREWSEGEGDNLTFYCEAKRRSNPFPSLGQFSVADARKAGLWQTEGKVTRFNKGTGKSYEVTNDSPWFRFPKRMLMWRARGYGLRDAFPDVLRGLISVEEAQDIVVERGEDRPMPGPVNATARSSLDRLEAIVDKKTKPPIKDEAASERQETEKDEPVGQTQTEPTGEAKEKPKEEPKADDTAKAADTGKEPVMTPDGTMTLRAWVDQVRKGILEAKTPADIQVIKSKENFLDNLAEVRGQHEKTAELLEEDLQDRETYLSQVKSK